MVATTQVLASVSEALIDLGRLSALAMLGERRMAAQRQRAREAVLFVEQGAACAEFLQRYYGVKPALVAWPTAARPDVRGALRDGDVDMVIVQRTIRELMRALAAGVRSLQVIARSSPLHEPMALQLSQLSAALPDFLESAKRGAPPSLPRETVRPTGPLQVFRGPQSVHLDPVFVPTFSLLRSAELAFGPPDSSPDLWCLSLREAMAAELCALSIVEYDGLPLAFYRDFAKQAWDEMRHAMFFLDCAVELLPEFVSSAPKDHPMLAGARRYLKTGRGFAVPLERGLYEVAWNATLGERLILMHLDAEAPSIAAFKQQLESPLWRARPALCTGLEITTRDEATHARLGRIWLAHLYPDRIERQRAIAQARLLRGVLMLATVSQYNGVPLGELMTRFATPRARRGDPARPHASD